MEKMEITFLGTGNMIPTKKRSHTAILLSYKSENILIDCGEGTQRQFRIAGISPSKLTKILITHWHGDHTLGLPGLLQTLAMNDYKKTLEIYGPKYTEHYISLLKKLVHIKLPLKINESIKKIADTKEILIESKSMDHDTPTLAYSFTIKDKIRLNKAKLKKLKLPASPLIGQLQQGKDIIFKGKKIKSKDVAYIEKGRKITFILDTAPNQNAIDLAKNSDVLVCESSFSNKEKELAKERKHLTAQDAAKIAKSAKVKKLILTHISQRYEHNTKPILEEAKKVFKNTKIVNDFDVIEV